MLAERWNLDEGVPEAIALHHGGATGTATPSPEIAVVQVAVQVPHIASGGEPDHALLRAALAGLGATAGLVDELLANPAAASAPPWTADRAGAAADRARPASAAYSRAALQPSGSSSPRSATSAASSVL